MPKYECPRCGYSTAIRTHMRNHFKRQTPCRIVHKEVNISDCIQLVLGENISNISKNEGIPSKMPQNISYNPSKITQNPSKTSKIPQKSLKNEGNISYNPQNISFANKTKLVDISSKKLLPNTCKYCKKQYSRKDNLNRHMKICKIRYEAVNECYDTNSSENSSDNDSQFYNNEYESYNHLSHDDESTTSEDHKPHVKDLYTKDEVYELIEKTKQEFANRETQSQTIISELRKQVEQLLRNQGSNNITYNTNIVLNAFGKENMSYITNEYIKGLISKGPINSIPQLLQHIHFNPEHQENHNIKIPNKKLAYAEIYNGSTWDITDRKQAIEDMTDKAYNLINLHYSGGNEYMNQFKELYENNDKSLTKRVTKDTEMMILNNQKQFS